MKKTQFNVPDGNEAPSPQPATANIVPSGASATKQNEEETIPRDADAMQKILESMGIKDFEPRVVEQFLELLNRYIIDVLLDSQIYMEHVGREELELEDIRLAIQQQVHNSFTEPPSVEYLLELGSQRNQQPFSLADKNRVLLPPAHHCLTAQNYQLNVRKKQRLNEDEETQEETQNGEEQEQD